MTETRRPFMAEIQAAKRARPGLGAEAAALPAAVAPAPAAAPPVTVDNTAVLAAVKELSDRIDRIISVDHLEIERIQTEISDIAGRIRATKAEMAALRHPLAEEDRFRAASQELSEVVRQTEGATHQIMSAAEEIEDIVGQLKASAESAHAREKVGEITDVLVRIYEACNFQDLTGQRITKVVTALSFIEERVEAMMSVWNKKEFETMPLPPSTTKKDGDLDLHGPASSSETISQDDIDKLFG
jgi:chemotaxis protein CheZ